MRLASLAASLILLVAAGVAPAVAAPPPPKEIVECCICSCGGPHAGNLSGGAAGEAPVICFQGPPMAKEQCNAECLVFGCYLDALEAGSCPETCTFINPLNPLSQVASTTAPLFGPIGMMLAALAAGLGGAWARLRRR